MRSALPQITTILLLLHMGFGCCFHHVHACAWDSCVGDHTPASDCNDHDHSPVVDANSLAEHDSSHCICHDEHHAHECSGEDCTFVAARSRLVNCVEEAKRLAPLMDQCISGTRVQLRSTRPANSLVADPARLASLRAHLALQVMLL